MRRALIGLILIAPALVLIGWLVAAQLPRWTAPQANWFAPNTPGVCAAVESLTLYGAQPDNVGGIGRDAALTDGVKIALQHYSIPDGVSILYQNWPALGVQATLPGEKRRGYYVVVVPLNNDLLPKAAIVYIDAATGAPRTLITAIADPAAVCDFDMKAALLAAAKSPPLILLVAYGVITTGGLVAWRLFMKKGRR